MGHEDKKNGENKQSKLAVKRTKVCIIVPKMEKETEQVKKEERERETHKLAEESKKKLCSLRIHHQELLKAPNLKP